MEVSECVVSMLFRALICVNVVKEGDHILLKLRSIRNFSSLFA